MRSICLFALALALTACGQKADDTAKAPGSKAASKAPASKAPATEAAKPPANASVHFVWPQDGSTVHEQFNVVFGVANMSVVPAGTAPGDVTKGHHHLIVDGKPIPAGTAVPMNDTHIHYGKGQTDATLELAPGKHTLTMQFADAAHISYGPGLSKTINIEVKPNPAEPARVFFVEPADGAKVKNPVKLKFGVAGMALKPAGEAVKDKTVGHHHVVVDGKPIPAGTVVPMNDTHIHYGKAQTEAELTLPKGKHTLTMQYADGLHMSYGPAMSTTITVEVE